MAIVHGLVFEGAETVPLGDPIQFLSATIDGAESAAVTGSNKLRRRVKLWAEADCWVIWGDSPNPTGAGDAMPMSAGDWCYHDIEAGYTIKAITRS